MYYHSRPWNPCLSCRLVRTVPYVIINNRQVSASFSSIGWPSTDCNGRQRIWKTKQKNKYKMQLIIHYTQERWIYIPRSLTIHTEFISERLTVIDFETANRKWRDALAIEFEVENANVTWCCWNMQALCTFVVLIITKCQSFIFKYINCYN